MSELSEQSCEACRIDAPHATEEQIAKWLPQIADWSMVMRDSVMQLERIYEFENFVQVLDFANIVGNLAECEAHHPTLVIEYGKMTVRWWTHKINGLHENDFIMAAKTDTLYNRGMA